MENLTIRPITSAETYLLDDFIYEAIFRRDGEELLPRSIIREPEIDVYIKDFGKEDDYGLVAEIDGTIVGAVWIRILSGEVKGFGHVDSYTPEFAISVYKEYRGKGIGLAIMKNMIDYLRAKGYQQASLAVQKDNYAVELYKNVGFEIFKESEEEYLMVCYFN